ncbi:MAG TPA: hypothetical protein VGN72_20570 [Tepidisphaeraceae bacterium]|nr:hypothetical protein [Tepidisphaeraceae bacterium]
MSTIVKKIAAGVAAVVAVGFAGHAVYQFLQAPEQGMPTVDRLQDRAPTPDELHVFAREDSELMAALSTRQRWVKLPLRGASVASSADGTTYFKMAAGSAEAFKGSFAEFAAGRSKTIRGNGSLLLVDSVGRHWGVGNSAMRDIVAHDGKNWLPPHPLPAPISTAKADQPTTRRASRGNGMTYVRSALEMPETGDVYFATTAELGDDRPAGLHRVDKVGNWSTIPYPPGTVVSRDVKLIRIAGGQVAIVPLTSGGIASRRIVQHYARSAGSGDLPALPPPAVLLWDGLGWSSYRPTARPGRTLSRVVALPDGSILTYTEHDAVELAWPTASGPMAEDNPNRVAARRLIERLSETDAVPMMDALAALMRLGPAGAVEVDAALADESAHPGQARVLLGFAKRELATLLSPTADAPSVPLLGGRFKVRWPLFLSHRADGQTRFYVEECADKLTGRLLGDGILTVTPAGQWSFTPLVDKGTFHYKDSSIAEMYVDTGEALFIGNKSFSVGSQVLSRSNKPFGIELKRVMIGDDVNGGRIFYEGADGGTYVCNLAIPDAANDYPLAYLDGASALYRTRAGASTAWTAMRQLYELRADGTATPINIPGPADTIAEMLWPLDDKAAIVWLRPRVIRQDYGSSDCFLYVDGRWLGPFKSSRALINAHATAFARHAPRDFIPQHNMGNRQSTFRIGSDRGRGLWFLGETAAFIANKTETLHLIERTSVLEYFDGKDWHDAWSPFASDYATVMAERFAPPETGQPTSKRDVPPQLKPPISDFYTILGSLDDGQTVVIHDYGRRCLWGLKYEAGRMIRTPLPGGETIEGVPTLVDVNGQAGWFSVAGSDGIFRTYRYAAGKLMPVNVAGQGFATDRAGRLWLRDGTTLRVIDATGRTASTQIQDLDRSTRLLEAEAGTLWAVGVTGVSRVKLSADGASLTNEPMMTWATPFSSLTDPTATVWADAAGGIWMRGADTRIGRLTPTLTPASTPVP